MTNWLGRSVSVIDTSTQKKIADIHLSPVTDPQRADHPSAITANPLRDEVYTANANSNTVSVIDTRTDMLAATIDVSLVPGSRAGAIPDGLAVSPDGRTLYVAEAGENAIAVVDLDNRRVEGFVPTAWYASAVQVSRDGRQLVVTNRQGDGAGPNPCGPLTPLTTCPPLDPDRDITPGGRDGVAEPDHADSMIKGSITLISLQPQCELSQPAAHQSAELGNRRAHTRAADTVVATLVIVRRAIWQDIGCCECSLTLEPAHSTGPVPVVAESARRTQCPVCIGRLPERLHYRVDYVRAPDSNDRLEQRRESSRL